MRRIARLLAPSAALLLLAACSDEYATRKYGIERGSQEQTRVATPPPLSLPPILTEHTLAAAGPAAPDQAAPGTQQARVAAGATEPANVRTAKAGRSAGETSLVESAGPTAQGDIRQQIDQDAQIGHADPAYSDALLFSPDGPRGSTPLIQREGEKSWFGSLF